MTHPEQVVAEWTRTASLLVKSWPTDAPAESIQRLDGIQALVDELMRVVEEAAFHAVFELLAERAFAVAGTCRVCGLRCERERKVVRVRRTRRTLGVEVWRYRCRSCRTNRSPVREWLGLESGKTTAGLDRALTALSTELSFGAAAAQMLEQHGHEVDPDRHAHRGDGAREQLYARHPQRRRVPAGQGLGGCGLVLNR